MRKLTAVILTLAMAVSMGACGSQGKDKKETAAETSVKTTAEAATEAMTEEATEAAVQSEETAEQETAGQGELRAFTDSAGRTVMIPENIERVAVSGPLAQITVFALCPDKLVGIASAWDKVCEEYLDTKYYELPELGQLYGGKGEMNLETLLDSDAQVVIDVGEPKASIVEDMDELQKQTGIPFVHITATLDDTRSAYRLLGELTGMEKEAEVLAGYCDDTYSRMKELSEKVEKVRLLYCLGDTGLNVIAQGSFHGEIIDLMADNLAVVDEPSAKGSGNEVDMEQILSWDPDVILFASDSIYDTVGEDDTWKQVKAIADGHYYEVPFGPYNWLGFPPSVQRYLGMLWMAQVLYPEQAQLDIYSETAKYFELFYHSSLTEEQFGKLTANSLGKMEQ